MFLHRDHFMKTFVSWIMTSCKRVLHHFVYSTQTTFFMERIGAWTEGPTVILITYLFSREKNLPVTLRVL